MPAEAATPEIFTITEQDLWVPPPEQVAGLAENMHNPEAIERYFNSVLRYDFWAQAEGTAAHTAHANKKGNCYGLAQIVDAHFTALPPESAVDSAIAIGRFSDTMLHSSNVLRKQSGEVWHIDLPFGAASVLRMRNKTNRAIRDWIGIGGSFMHVWTGTKKGSTGYHLQTHETEVPNEHPPIKQGNDRLLLVKGVTGRIALAAQSTLIEAIGKPYKTDEDTKKISLMKHALKPMIPSIRP